MLGRDELLHFLRQKPEAALDMMATMARRLRETDIKLRQMAARNVNQEIEQKLTPVQQITDWIAAFSGSIYFLGLHVIWFAIWIGLNTLWGTNPFDPFPFGLLTMVVSLEAIFLSVIVLLSQNRQAAKDRIRVGHRIRRQPQGRARGHALAAYGRASARRGAVAPRPDRGSAHPALALPRPLNAGFLWLMRRFHGARQQFIHHLAAQ